MNHPLESGHAMDCHFKFCRAFKLKKLNEQQKREIEKKVKTLRSAELYRVFNEENNWEKEFDKEFPFDYWLKYDAKIGKNLGKELKSFIKREQTQLIQDFLEIVGEDKKTDFKLEDGKTYSMNEIIELFKKALSISGENKLKQEIRDKIKKL